MPVTNKQRTSAPPAFRPIQCLPCPTALAGRNKVEGSAVPAGIECALSPCAAGPDKMERATEQGTRSRTHRRSSRSRDVLYSFLGLFLPRVFHQFLLRPNFRNPGAQVDRLHSVGARETRVDASQRNCHVGNLLILDHHRNGLEILIRRRAHSPSARTIV